MITIISATNRRDSLTIKVANYYSKLLASKNISNQVMDLCELPPDFMYSNSFGATTDAFSEMIQKYVNDADKFVVISPEYHGSYPGVFKSLMDCIGGEGLSEGGGPYEE